MGARTTWEIRTYEGSPSIYLYSHWGGESKWEKTIEAMRACEPRWGDPSYGARIFISTIIGHQWESETGFGITAGGANDNPFEEEYLPVIIDFGRQVVETPYSIHNFSDFSGEKINFLLT